MKKVIYALSILTIVSCTQMSHKKVCVDVVFSNTSRNSLDWPKLIAGDRELSVGVLIPNKDAILLGVSWTNIPDQAKVTFVDEQTRKRYNIEVALKDVNARVYSGQCKRVTIRILDYDKAEVVCK